MALVFSDGFSLYQNLTGATLLKGYTGSTGSSDLSFRSAGRWGSASYGVYIDVTGPARGNLVKSIATSGSTSIVGIAVMATGAIQTNGVTFFTISNGSSTVALNWNTNRVITITDGSATTYFTIPSGLAAGVWYYLELKIVWNATTGRIVYRMDTSQYYDSGTTLSLGSSTNANSISIGTNSGVASNCRTMYTDLVVLDGSGASLNDFQGDIRIETLHPDSDGASTTWSLPNNTLLTSVNQARITTDTSGWAALSGSPTLTRIAANGPLPLIPSYLQIDGSSGASVISNPNGVSGYPVSPGQSLGIGAYYATSGGGASTDISLRFYDGAGTQVGSDVSAGSFWQPSAGTWAWNSFSATVPAGAATCAIILTRTNTKTSQFTAFVLSNTSTTARYVDPSGAHYFETADQTYDSDSSYVMTNTIGAKDTYSLDSLQSTSGSVLGVTAYAVARKESASTHTINTVVRANGTDHSGTVTNLPDNLTYQAMNDFYPLNPTTGVAWTRSDINSMETGVELPS